MKYTGWLWTNNNFGKVSQKCFHWQVKHAEHCVIKQFCCAHYVIKIILCFVFQVFDGNTETDKTFKFKTGKGKVIKVDTCFI